MIRDFGLSQSPGDGPRHRIANDVTFPIMLSAVSSRDAPKPSGPYSQAIQAGDLLFVAGQLPLSAEGLLVGDGDIGAQTRAVLSNIGAILEAAGSSLNKAVKTTVFLADLADFAGMNEAYETAFSEPYPARSTVGIGRLPPGMLIEIDCIALV
jgi:2-iminobutanoate/2-iminopropanoate deaminase